MREIKFRAWDTVMKDWVPMGLNSISELVFIAVGKQPGRFTIDTFDSEAERFILMQFTGLKDKNGKEIYEGDVIQNLIGTAGEIMFSQTINGYFTGFGVQYKDTKSHWGINPLECEVIGNVHEHPSLLGEPK